MHTASQKIENRSASPLELVLEPWSNVYSVAPRTTWVVTLRSALRGQIEVVREPGCVTVFAWPGCTAQMSIDDVVVETLDTPAPGLPLGTSMRHFVEATFGFHPSRRP